MKHNDTSISLLSHHTTIIRTSSYYTETFKQIIPTSGDILQTTNIVSHGSNIVQEVLLHCVSRLILSPFRHRIFLQNGPESANRQYYTNCNINMEVVTTHLQSGQVCAFLRYSAKQETCITCPQDRPFILSTESNK